MGWQSYAIGYETNEEFNNIMKTILEHNNERNQDIIGEELIGVVKASFKPYKQTWNITNNKVVLFGNGGGRSYTFDYFQNKGFKIRPYDSGMKRRITKVNEIPIPPPNYMFFNLENKEVFDLIDMSDNAATEHNIVMYLEEEKNLRARSLEWKFDKDNDYLEVYNIDWSGF